jgi:hypothetical protein
MERNRTQDDRARSKLYQYRVKETSTTWFGPPQLRATREEKLIEVDMSKFLKGQEPWKKQAAKNLRRALPAAPLVAFLSLLFRGFPSVKFETPVDATKKNMAHEYHMTCRWEKLSLS